MARERYEPTRKELFAGKKFLSRFLRDGLIDALVDLEEHAIDSSHKWRLLVDPKGKGSYHVTVDTSQEEYYGTYGILSETVVAVRNGYSPDVHDGFGWDFVRGPGKAEYFISKRSEENYDYEDAEDIGYWDEDEMDAADYLFFVLSTEVSADQISFMQDSYEWRGAEEAIEEWIEEIDEELADRR